MRRAKHRHPVGRVDSRRSFLHRSCALVLGDVNPKTATFSRPGASIVIAGAALFSLLVFVVELVRERFTPQLLISAILLLGFAEVIYFLGRIAWQLEQNSAPKEPAAAPEIPPAESFDAKVERHRAALREQLNLDKQPK
jgi:hypothetical protein